MRRRACQIKNKIAKRFWREATEEKKFPDVYAVCVFDLQQSAHDQQQSGVTTRETNISVPLPFSFEKQFPEEYFVGRNGGDEFLAILRGLNREEVEACMNHIRTQTAEYSRQHPEMPISYAAGYAISLDFAVPPPGTVPAGG